MADAAKELSTVLSDEELWGLISRCDVAMLKTLLAKAAVPSNVKKENLQWRLFYSIRLGLPVIKTEDEKEIIRQESRQQKLKIGQMSIPHPLTLEDWQDNCISYPDVTKVDIEYYFDQCKY